MHNIIKNKNNNLNKRKRKKRALSSPSAPKNSSSFTVLKSLEYRRTRLNSRIKFHNEISYKLSLDHVSLNSKKTIQSSCILSHDKRQPNKSNSISSLDIDKNESRYLLSSSINGSISIHDLLDTSATNKSNNIQSEFKPIAQSAAKSRPINIVKWYPIDSGLFLSCSKQGSLLELWDTNAFQAVLRYSIPHSKHVPYCVSDINPKDGSSILIGCSSSDGVIYNSDITSGACSHTFLGHKGTVSSLLYYKDYNFISTGMDGTIRFWDLRKSGANSCYLILNSEVSNFVSKTKSKNPNQFRSLQEYSTSSSTSILSSSLSEDLQYLVLSLDHDITPTYVPISIWDVACTTTNSTPKQLPCRFLPSSTFESTRKQDCKSSFNNNSCLKMHQPNYASQKLSSIWYTPNNYNEVWAYQLYKPYGQPICKLTGHLDHVTAFTSKDDNQYEYYTGSNDGMILSWSSSFSKNNIEIQEDFDDWNVC